MEKNDSNGLYCKSPDGNLTIGFSSTARGLQWWLVRKGETLVTPSRLGLSFSIFKEAGHELGEMRITGCTPRSSNETWTNRLYRRHTIRDNYNELEVALEEVAEPHRRLAIVLRAYNGGAAFRYVVPAQDGVLGFELLREVTEWRFPGRLRGWFTSYESHLNSDEKTFKLREISDISHSELIGLPASVEVAGQWVALCEAALVNWAGFYFRTPEGGQPDGSSVFEAELAPLPPSSAATSGAAVIRTTPAASPWRVAICADSQIGLLENNDIILNLNPPPEEGIDFGFVKPGATSWDWWVESNNSLSTELTLRLVDFAAEMGWPYHTIDGGWYGFARRPNHGPNVELAPRKGFDLKRIVEHAREKGVGIWVWMHWQEVEDTGIEETFSRLEKWGVKGAKLDFHDRQDQWMVCWYEKVARAAARHRIMVNFHGSHRPTGTERTWPNILTREGIRGNEMSKFFDDITPEHCLTLPFTRFLIGPGDFTPGSFGNVYGACFVPQRERGHRYGDETDRRQIWAEEI
ncbi:MAG: glycoside hydrolase family 97 catalytic domain-containing protein, partial [Kiritimatiellae bacterium]|nr:glycoside hydrolase family 97 catalytic domain-containing protein [Kiritimatiellia bacterium]